MDSLTREQLLALLRTLKNSVPIKDDEAIIIWLIGKLEEKLR